MRIRIYADPLIHRLGVATDDQRVWWTACRKRFAWGQVTGDDMLRKKCPTCWPNR